MDILLISESEALDHTVAVCPIQMLFDLGSGARLWGLCGIDIELLK